MFCLHLLIGRISSKKYWRVAKKNNAHFKRGNSNKILFLRNPYKNPNERKKIEFSKNVKN